MSRQNSNMGLVATVILGACIASIALIIWAKEKAKEEELSRLRKEVAVLAKELEQTKATHDRLLSTLMSKYQFSFPAEPPQH